MENNVLPQTTGAINRLLESYGKLVTANARIQILVEESQKRLQQHLLEDKLEKHPEIYN